MALPSNFDDIQQMITAGKTDTARNMLKTRLQRTPSDPNTWWLFAQVAENVQQRYFILEELLKLPTNQYTTQARAIQSRLPYQHPSSNPLKVHASSGRNASAMLLIGSIGITLVVVLMALFVVVNKQPAMAASSMSEQPQTQLNGLQPTQQQIVVTLTPRSTSTPLPTKTSMPTRTLRPTSTARPQLPTATATLPPDMSELVPPLYTTFSESVTSMKQSADEASAMLKDSSAVSIETLSKVTEQLDSIRKIRSQVTLINLRVIPVKVRREVILPAHNAFINYINAYLNLIEEEIVSAKLYKAAMQPDVEDFDTAFQLYEDQAEVVTKKTDMVNAAYEALTMTMQRYQVYAATEEVKGEVSGQAIILSGFSTSQTVTLAAGTYVVLARSAEPVSIQLRSVNDNNRVFQANSDSQTLNIPSGKYQIEVERVDWWLLALDPV
jgi:hypothetical protein